MRIRIMLGAIKLRFTRPKHNKTVSTIVADPAIVKAYIVKRIYTFDVDSPEDRLAQESLVFVSTNKGTNTYTDDGITANAAFFEDLCNANRQDITKYYANQLKRRNLNY